MVSIDLSDLINTKSHELPKDLDKFNVIYKITNKLNDKCYIGKTKSFKMRLYSNAPYGYLDSIHKWILSGYSGKLTRLFNAIRFHGVNNFKFTILEYDIPLDNLNEREIYWITKYNSYKGHGYNSTKGGDGGHGNPTEWSRLAAREASVLNYPNTNGISENCIYAGIKARKELYPDTNGFPPQATQSWRYNAAKRSFDALIDMCTKASLDGLSNFNRKSDYIKYKVDYTPRYDRIPISLAFRNYREFGFDLTLISQFIRSDWQ